jgi:hypothetical protein
MKMVRERADARWLPSRHRFALFRLLAYARFRSTGPIAEPGLALGIDRDQSAIENYTVAAWVMGTATCFVFALLDRVLVTPAAIALAPFVAASILQAFVVAPGFVSGWRNRDNTGPNSFLTMLALALTAIYLAQSDRWVRAVAWLFLASLAANAIASLIARLLRTRFAAAENDLVP